MSYRGRVLETGLVQMPDTDDEQVLQVWTDAPAPNSAFYVSDSVPPPPDGTDVEFGIPDGIFHHKARWGIRAYRQIGYAFDPAAGPIK